MVPVAGVQPRIPSPSPECEMPQPDEISEEGFGCFVTHRAACRSPKRCWNWPRSTLAVGARRTSRRTRALGAVQRSWFDRRNLPTHCTGSCCREERRAFGDKRASATPVRTIAFVCRPAPGRTSPMATFRSCGSDATPSQTTQSVRQRSFTRHPRLPIGRQAPQGLDL